MVQLWNFSRLPASRQRRLARAMQISLVGILLVGLYDGDSSIIVNTAVALCVTHLPAVLEREYGVSLDARLSLWITSAVFLHAFGMVGVPWTPLNPYQSVWWWDHLTHSLSASVVAAVGYSTARIVDSHSGVIEIPPRFMFVYIVLFVLAFGVLWEVLEFAVSRLAFLIGGKPVLVQYGIEDTLLDLVFDVVGGVAVATRGTELLDDVLQTEFPTRLNS